MFNRLTIVLITYNRHKYLERTINYWSNIKVNLLILDGTNSPFNNELIPKNSLAKINYIHYPHSLNSRLKHALNFIKTEYVLLASDDEYFLPSGILDSVNFLDNEPDYIACIGRTVSFNIENNKIIYWPEYEDMQGYEVDSNNPYMRMYSHMGEYTCNTIFSVVRFKEWQVAIKIITSYNFNVYSIQEYQFENVISFLGKSKVINSLMWLRNQENPSLYATSPIELFYNWWKQSKYKRQRDLFIKIQVDNIFEYKNIDKDKLKNAIKLSYDIFLNWYSFNYPIPNFRKNSFKYLVFILPFKLKKYLFRFRKILDLFSSNKSNILIQQFNLNSILNYLTSNKITYNIKDFRDAVNSLNKFHNINE
jgi:glycosyltransferase domain-containing protein